MFSLGNLAKAKQLLTTGQRLSLLQKASFGAAVAHPGGHHAEGPKGRIKVAETM